MRTAFVAGVLGILLTVPGAAESLFYSREFPQSVPPYFEVEIDANGTVTYREERGEEDPLTFVVDASERERIVELVRSIGPANAIASKRKGVAFTGDKTLRLADESGSVWEAKFVHTESEAAAMAVKWFNLVSESERHRIELERVIIFDRLGVNKALLYFHRSFDKGRIVGPKQFLPVLQKIADGKGFVHMARTRAASLIELIERGEVPESAAQ